MSNLAQTLIDSAWDAWHAALRKGLQTLLAIPEAADPKVRAQAHLAMQMMQTSASGLYLIPRHQFPALYSHNVFLPSELSWGLPAADFTYRWGSIDGTHTYRIWGKRGTTCWLHCQLNAGFWGDEECKALAALDLDRIEYGPGGTFEIILSPERHEGNWIKLNPKARNIVIQVREIWVDWEKETGSELHIECLDRLEDAIVDLDEEEVADRIRKAARFIDNNIAFILRSNAAVTEHGGYKSDRFGLLSLIAPKDRTDQGGNPEAYYIDHFYDIQPGEALIIECAMPQTMYWSIQLSTMFWQNLDHTYRQSSLNQLQALADHDGKVRIVLSLEDPGVANWLDAQQPGMGLAQWRWYRTDRCEIPTVRKVALADLAQELPAGTRMVTPAERAEAVRRRERSSLRRYGF